MKKYFLVFLTCGFLGQAQMKPVISKDEVARIETELASDKMQGRKVFTAGIDSASVFIEKEFAKMALDYYEGLSGYRQEFKA